MHDHFIFHGHYLAMISLFQNAELSRIGAQVRYIVQSFISYASPAYNSSSDTTGDQKACAKESGHEKLRSVGNANEPRRVGDGGKSPLV